MRSFLTVRVTQRGSLVVVLALLNAGQSLSTTRGNNGDDPAAQRIVLDCHYNNEWKRNATGTPVRFHYIWDDTADSGFSQLGAIIGRVGGMPDTLCQRPTRENLKDARVYIIVDPDTPEETESPHVIDTDAIETIVSWVHAGGSLVLLGNDRGKAEFRHFNDLAGRFGVRFNEDSRNRVSGRAFEIGTFDKFPTHPLFEGVKKIFIKELSTLTIHAPAEAVLVEGGDTIMAIARVGGGCVFAVGDPWFYNEYMDQRRLPAGYDNARAAGNLFRWLLNNRGNQGP
jgi:unsaturated rhamnogalacturonyl hydrolase